MAPALHHKLTIVTRNVRDFAELGAAVFNPWADEPKRGTCELSANRPSAPGAPTPNAHSAASHIGVCPAFAVVHPEKMHPEIHASACTLKPERRARKASTSRSSFFPHAC